jgi:deoxyribonuclease (pyrimidine dimer)
MVRINLIEPKLLADQHLVAEYHEIGMLLGYIRKHPKVENIPEEFDLGEGHIKFFKNKVGYLKERSGKLRKEMKRRGFVVKVNFDFSIYKGKEYYVNWKPTRFNYKVIIERISERLMEKPDWYRYKGTPLGDSGVDELMLEMENIYLRGLE